MTVSSVLLRASVDFVVTLFKLSLSLVFTRFHGLRASSLLVPAAVNVAGTEMMTKET